MKRYVFFLFISVSVLAQEERKVAVFDPAGTVEKALLEIVREEISSVVVNTTGYTVLERQLINKVLEENKFQESGLVNDEQMSDIGKRMGADYVFVTSISPLGANYYISCKMIEVATARIEKQFTGTTTNGINDIPQTTQYIVRRLFGENVQQTEAKNQRNQTERQVQDTENQRNVTSMNRQSETSTDRYSLPIPSKGTTIRNGFEIQSDVFCMEIHDFRYAGSAPRIGANLSVIYRFKPKFALGLGAGIVSGAYPTKTWNPFFFDIIYNFKKTKFSPFIALEIGADRYPIKFRYYSNYNYDYYVHVEYGFSIGVISGFQYSFNDHFALIMKLKGLAVTNYNANKIGIGVGVVYHF